MPPDDVKQATHEAAVSRNEILKATVVAARGTTHVQPYQDEADRYFSGVGAIEPPYDPTVLMLLLEHSNALRQCIDAYVTNIDAFGHHFEPIVDLNAADADARLTSYLMARKSAAAPAVVDDPNQQIPLPTPEELGAAKAELTEKMRVEKMKAEHFFDFACLDHSFVTLRRRTRQDLEMMGNAYWEVLRDATGIVAGFEYVPGFTVRHMKADTRAVPVSHRVKVNEFDYGAIPARKHFRTFVQVYETRVIFFKEFGDPRVISSKTGRAYPDMAAFELDLKENADDAPATEMLHFRIHTPKSSYGIPRWIGTILSVLGSRQAEEVNLSYFENKSVPPLAVLVQGGRMTNESITRMQDFIENEIKGKKNFHKILVLEAEGQGVGSMDNGRMKIDLKPLTGAQHNDALFQTYDQNNIDKIGMSFRLPRMLRGDIRDFNRATADAALGFAETQVFGPERDEFDFTINRKILPVLGLRFWRFKSHTATATNPQDLASMIGSLSTAGVLVPAEGRELAEKVFNRELRKIDEPWVRQPISLTEKGLIPAADPNAPAPDAGAPTAGAPLGGAAMAAGATPPAGSGVSLTGTDLASIVTVNEARANIPLPPLALAPDKGGGPDPDGFLTVAEFKAKRMAAGQITGTDEGQTESGGDPNNPVTPPPAMGGAAKDMSTGDLAANGGLAIGGQRRMRRLPQGHEPPTTKSDILTLAADLLTLRKTMSDLEVAEVEEQFRKNLADTKAAEDPDNGGPIEG